MSQNIAFRPVSWPEDSGKAVFLRNNQLQVVYYSSYFSSTDILKLDIQPEKHHAKRRLSSRSTAGYGLSRRFVVRFTDEVETGSFAPIERWWNVCSGFRVGFWFVVLILFVFAFHACLSCSVSSLGSLTTWKS